MTTTSLYRRAPDGPAAPGPPPGPLGSPLAFAAVVGLLLLVFSWTFIADPGRAAPGDDPAFYTWRTEALLSEEPATLLETTGPQDVLAGGYRVTTPVLGGILRRTLGIAPLTTTIILTVGIRVCLALLLAGFAYRHRRDPLVFHGVALGSASLFLSPPFFGYLDNLLCLLFLTASLFLIERLRASWAARATFFILLFLAGMTHPTTLVFFCVVLGAMSALRWVVGRAAVRTVVRDDIAMLLTAATAAIAVVLVWRVGAWGPSVSLAEAAVPPPADDRFFFVRLTDWVRALRPLLNGPLLAVGLVALLAGGRRAGEDEMSRVTLAWLLPLAGVFGFVAGLAYPYYRFFNTTLSWVLLIGFGAAVATRFFIERARTAGPLVLVGVVAVAAVIVTNFLSTSARWSDPDEAWLTERQQEELGVIRDALQRLDGERPVVFAIDTEATDRVRIYGFMKFSANVSRHALPHGYLDRGYVFLGDVDDLLAGRPSEGPNDAYQDISAATLEDVRTAEGDPIVVVAGSFNQTGANAGLVDEQDAPPDVWVADGGRLLAGGETVERADLRRGSLLRLPLVLAGLCLLLLPGIAAARGLVPGAGLAQLLGLAPALAVALITMAGFVVLSLARSPLSVPLAWLAVAVALAGGVALWRGRGAPAE